MTTDEIKEKHTSLVSGGYAEMLPEARIKYHTRTTLMAIIEELKEMGGKMTVGSMSQIWLYARANELQQELDK